MKSLCAKGSVRKTQMDIKDREERMQLGQQKPRREMVTLCASQSEERVPIYLTALRLDGFLELETNGGPFLGRRKEYRVS